GGGAMQPGALQERHASRRHDGRLARSLAYPVEADFLEHLAALGPAFVHFDVEEQVHRHPQHLAQLRARGFADGFDAGPAFSKDDRLLAVTSDDDLLADLDATVLALLVTLGPHGTVIGQLLMKLAV